MPDNCRNAFRKRRKANAKIIMREAKSILDRASHFGEGAGALDRAADLLFSEAKRLDPELLNKVEESEQEEDNEAQAAIADHKRRYIDFLELEVLRLRPELDDEWDALQMAFRDDCRELAKRIAANLKNGSIASENVASAQRFVRKWHPWGALPSAEIVGNNEGGRQEIA